MELLDRYLQAVGFWLPKSQRQDIIAELSEDLRSQIEEKEGELGRSLDGPELEHLLKQRGAPLLVAERYLPQRHLIGPRLFPIYALVLRSAVTYYLLPWLLVWLGFLVFDPAYRAASPGVAIVGTLKGLWLMAVYGFAFTTAAFALLEQCQANARFLETWDPRRLPPVRNPSQMPRGNQVAELTWNVVLILWWTGVLHLPRDPRAEHPAGARNRALLLAGDGAARRLDRDGRGERGASLVDRPTGCHSPCDRQLRPGAGDRSADGAALGRGGAACDPERGRMAELDSTARVGPLRLELPASEHPGPAAGDGEGAAQPLGNPAPDWRVGNFRR